MKRVLTVWGLVGLLCAVSGAAPTSVLVLDTGSAWDAAVVTALSNVTSTEVSTAAFAGVTLSDYDVLYVGSTFTNGSVTVASQSTLNALNARSADIASFLASGHGVVALSEPIGTGRFSWVPTPVTVTGPSHGNGVVIVNGAHPVMQGLTSASLSNWGSSYHNSFPATGGLDVLATTTAGAPLTLAGSYGCGRLVLTGQDADFHYFYNSNKTAQLALVQNAVDWAGAASCTVPVPGAALLAGMGAGLVGWLRRRRGL